MIDSSSDGGFAPGDPDVGCELTGDTSAFVSMSGAFYRGVVERMATWRTRLDQTTNRAVIVMAAVLTWAFSSPDNPHYVVLVGMAAMSVFLLVEAYRYREYDSWRDRVRLLERNLIANMYEPRGADNVDWRSQLSKDLTDPEIRLSLNEALAHRLHRVYFL